MKATHYYATTGVPIGKLTITFNVDYSIITYCIASMLNHNHPVKRITKTTVRKEIIELIKADGNIHYAYRNDFDDEIEKQAEEIGKTLFADFYKCAFLKTPKN